LRTSHPINVEVKSVSEIGEIFDAISYSKGSAFLRMIMSYTSESKFYEGVSHFLKCYQYSNADYVDFLTALGEKCSSSNIAELSKEWLLKPNYPMLVAKKEGKKTLGHTESIL